MRDCRGWCNRYKCNNLIKPLYKNHNRCTVCEVYYPKFMNVCPCCKCILRTRAYNNKSRKVHLETVKFIWIYSICMYRMQLYIPVCYEKEMREFIGYNGKSTSRTICSLVEQFNNTNIRLHIPTIRKILQKNPDQIKYLRELLQ